MTENLFTALSTYRPGGPAAPFEVYCASGLAHLLQANYEGIVALLCERAGVETARVSSAETQAQREGSHVADILVGLEDGEEIVVETAVLGPTSEEELPARPSRSVSRARPVYVGLGEQAPAGWSSLRWETIAEALRRENDALAEQFAEFIERDVLGLGPVDGALAIGSNRLFAMGAAAVRERFGDEARSENSASMPLGRHYRYLGTTFAPDGGAMTCWIGLVNDSVPLGDRYRLMLGSKDTPVDSPCESPRATADWNWPHWTEMGRVDDDITMEMYRELLSRLRR